MLSCASYTPSQRPKFADIVDMTKPAEWLLMHHLCQLTFFAGIPCNAEAPCRSLKHEFRPCCFNRILASLSLLIHTTYLYVIFERLSFYIFKLVSRAMKGISMTGSEASLDVSSQHKRSWVMVHRICSLSAPVFHAPCQTGTHIPNKISQRLTHWAHVVCVLVRNE